MSTILKIEVHTDGSVKNNGSSDSQCGWSYKLIYPGGKEIIKSGSGDMGDTNNRMEMAAVLEALRAVTDKSAHVDVYSDSELVVKTMRGEYGYHKNGELWEELFAEVKKFPEGNVTFTWEKAHEKNEHNNEVDKAAKEAAKGN